MIDGIHTEMDAFMERMNESEHMLFSTLPPAFQAAYFNYWQSRPNRHAAHRDTLPAFVAGVWAGVDR